MKYYLKLVTGYESDRHYTIDAEEAHKAYYLFRHPEERGVFNDGLALSGRDIRVIQPDYHTTMGWNVTHELDDEDWNYLNAGVSEKLKQIMGEASRVSYLAEQNPALLGQKLSEINSKGTGPYKLLT